MNPIYIEVILSDFIPKMARGLSGKTKRRHSGDDVVKKYNKSVGVPIDFLRETYFLYKFKGLQNIVQIRGHKAHVGKYKVFMTDAGVPITDHVWTYSDSETRRLMFQLLAGARQLHSRGYVHGDIKPANVLVRDDVVRICDFAGCQKAGSTSWVVTTKWYSPPEYMQNPYDTFDLCPSFDMYSIGCMFFEIVMGSRFIDADAEQLSRVCGSHGTDLIMNLIDDDPNKRMTSAEAMEHPFFQDCHTDIVYDDKNDGDESDMEFARSVFDNAIDIIPHSRCEEACMSIVSKLFDDTPYELDPSLESLEVDVFNTIY